ncbi:FAD-binding domain-containing protein [Dissoconium aciculare CBS 342.82]|uniref:FAD-binding domain-containing protein n=1 Tax=Dissoconium aciculare CBS 342.82 TaxID=1314786 RepID=A0A6J3MB10_9PEZI|nr:FAD-binding domain-containing protein [Dissoconium aciculare CBS 342.82]KAF1825043.1 FAD-binding domain-containing protein [Dissoconium aciculare CBS 342.82]
MPGRRPVSTNDIEAIRQILSNTQTRIITPSDQDYADSIHSWSRAAEKPSGVSILPASVEDVSKVVRYANDNGIDLAVKGGGHSTSGASSTDGGILINLKSMRKVTIDPSSRHIFVQGGCLWMDVDAAAWEHGLATVGGTVADTGVGGLALGGGYGHLTGKHGLVIDNIVQVTVVVANGEILTANKQENAELFWGLLGAGQNFGVATEFVFQGYPQGDIYAGTLAYAATKENIEAVVAAANELYESRGQTGTLIALVKSPDGSGQTLLLLMVSCVAAGAEATGKQLFAPFFALNPLLNDVAVRPYPHVNNLVPNLQGMRCSLKGAATILPLRADFVGQVRAKFDEFVESTPDAKGSLIAFEMYDACAVMARQDNGSFANRGWHLNALISPQWEKAENDTVCRQWARDIAGLFREELESKGVNVGSKDGVEGGVGARGEKGAVLLYGNYDLDEVSRDVFGANYARLQAIKARYDPGNLFDKLFAVQPLVT